MRSSVVQIRLKLSLGRGVPMLSAQIVYNVALYLRHGFRSHMCTRRIFLAESSSFTSKMTGDLIRYIAKWALEFCGELCIKCICFCRQLVCLSEYLFSEFRFPLAPSQIIMSFLFLEALGHFCHLECRVDLLNTIFCRFLRSCGLVHVTARNIQFATVI